MTAATIVLAALVRENVRTLTLARRRSVTQALTTFATDNDRIKFLLKLKGKAHEVST